MAKGEVALPSDFAGYLALGDSMSIDRYPSLHLLEGGALFVPRIWDAELPGPRITQQFPELRAGAASLLFRNDDELWPEFGGRDLVSSLPRLRLVSLAEDGAMIADVAGPQLKRARRFDPEGSIVVTRTAGGNDLLHAYGDARSRTDLDRAARRIASTYEALVAEIHHRFPTALIVVTTVYDPSDGTGYIPGFQDSGDRLPLDVLGRFNDAVRHVARMRSWVRVADAYGWFLGHGARADPGEGWYWPRSMIEPGARGASELRRLWLAAAGRESGTGGA